MTVGFVYNMSDALRSSPARTLGLTEWASGLVQYEGPPKIGCPQACSTKDKPQHYLQSASRSAAGSSTQRESCRPFWVADPTSNLWPVLVASRIAAEWMNAG